MLHLHANQLCIQRSVARRTAWPRRTPYSGAKPLLHTAPNWRTHANSTVSPTTPLFCMEGEYLCSTPFQPGSTAAQQRKAARCGSGVKETFLNETMTVVCREKRSGDPVAPGKGSALSSCTKPSPTARTLQKQHGNGQCFADKEGQGRCSSSDVNA